MMVANEKANRSHGRRGGLKSGIPKIERGAKNQEAWQQKADKIWAKNPNLSKRSVAKSVSKSLGGKPEYIRQILVKPACVS
ncbi:MAG: hypothetical protein ABSC11_14045 [Smithella sp.]